MNRKDQLAYLKILGLDVNKVTNKSEIEAAQKQILDEARRRGLSKVPQDFINQLEKGLYEITDIKVVKKAYRTMAKKHHPDLGGDEEKFKEIHFAFKMLTDASFAVAEMKSKKAGQTNLDAIFNITISFDQAFFGDKVTLTFSPIHLDDNGNPVTLNEEEDVLLEGKVFHIRITEGTPSKYEHKIKGEGLIQGDRSGDFILVFNVEPHPKFKLRGSDIVSEERIPLDIMLTGGEIDIVTMWGVKVLEVPPGTKPYDELVITKAGVAKIGHHCVRVDPEYPQKQELKDKDVWKKLGIKWAKYEKKETDMFSEEEIDKFFQNKDEKNYSDTWV